MPLLATEAAKLSIEDRQRGVIEELIDREELFALLPFVRSDDETYSYVREKTVAQGAFFDAYEDLEESASTFEPVSTKLKRFGAQVDVDNFMWKVQSGLNDQRAIQVAQKVKGIGQQFKNVFVNGDVAANPKGFDGLRKLTVPSQTLVAGANGGALSFAALDELKSAVALGADFLMMRQGTWLALRALNRAMGGNTADHIMVDNFGYPMKAYDGTPVIINDYLPVDEVQGTNEATTSIYAMRANEADGFHGLYGGDSAGFEITDLGVLEKKDASRTRIIWYVGAALKATHAVARIKGITNI